MAQQNPSLWMKTGMGLAVLAFLVLGGCDGMAPKASEPQESLSARAKLDRDRRLKRACGSAETYDRLKAIAFDDVARRRGGGTTNLDLLASGSVVRMVAPVAKSRDEALNITTCAGHMILELPVGTAAVFGAQRLEADVEYAAQEAADGSGLVYRLQGAEPIVARIATSPFERLASLAPQPTTRDGPIAPPAMAERDSLPASASASTSMPTPTPTPTPASPVRPRSATERPVEATVRPAPARQARAAPDREVAAPVPQVRVSTRPSFNCRYARSRSEKLVCGDADLARRDRIMSSTFYAALARGNGQTKAALRASRDRFLRFRDSCPDADCVARSYADRMDEIRDIQRDE